MTIEALKDVKLSPVTAGYLAIYLKLSELYGEMSQIAEMECLTPSQVCKVTENFDIALSKAQDEAMNLAVSSMTEHLLSLDNNTHL